MAFTNTLVEKTVFGNMRCHMYNVTADAASGTIPTGLSTISAHSISPVSMGTAAILAKVSTGTITISNAVNGDNFYVTVFGR